jgi:DNA primase
MTGRPRRPQTRGGSSPEARQQQLEALHEHLAQQVEALRSGADWQRWLTVASRFPTYSFANTLLILAQRPDATAVAGYQAWRTLGRQVGKGERGIRILAPVLRRPDRAKDVEDEQHATADPSDDLGERPARRLAGFRVTHVWDVSQTNGKPLPERPAPTSLEGEAPDGLWDNVTAEIARRGYRVQRGDTGEANGWTDPVNRVVRVADALDNAQAARTLVHELAHVILHTEAPPSTPEGRAVCRGAREVEAESVAFLVCTSRGMSADGYTFPYVAGWAEEIPGDNVDAVRATGTRVLAAARDILQHLAAAAADQVADEHRLMDRAPRGQLATTALRRRADATHQAAMGPADPPPARRSPTPKPTTDTLIEVHAIAQRFYATQQPRSWVPEYLAGRGLEAALEVTWGAGHAPRRWRALTAHLSGAGISERLLLESGLVTRARSGSLIDRFRDRLMLPLRNENGDIIGFIGRAAPDAGEDTPKYLNSPETPIYSKHQYLYGRFEGRTHFERGARAVLVEGPLDAIAVTAGTRGRGVGLATCGTAVTDAHIASLIAATRPDATLVVATDHDAAGNNAAERALLLLGHRGRNPLAAQLTPVNDPADILRREGAAALTSTLVDSSAPLADRVIGRRLAAWRDRLHWAEGRVAAVRDVAPLVAQLPEAQAVRQVHRVAAYVGTDPGLVIREVAQHVAAEHGAPPTPKPARQPHVVTGGRHHLAR